MGVQELLMISGAVLLAVVLVYGVIRAGRRPQSAASEDATKRMYDDNRNT
jgi:hypothetical protein